MTDKTWTVLVVDDSTFARRMVVKALVDTEFTVIDEAGNGNEAMQKFAARPTQLVLMDVIMPEKTGLETVKELVKHQPPPKVIMLSSLGTEDAVTECLESGALGFVQKPFERESLLANLRKLVGAG